MAMLLKASPTAETTWERNSWKRASRAPRNGRRQAAETVRRATSRCSSIPCTSRRMMCLPPKRTHCNTMEPAPTANRRTQTVDGRPVSPGGPPADSSRETGYPSPRTVTSPVQFAKRGIDIVVSLVGLAATLPLYPAIMAAIAIDSRGPLFFRQKRAGRLLSTSGHGRDLKFEEFSMIKFRTMKVDAEKATGAVLADEQDPRISRVGRFLRKSRLDEIPQFWNVLRGDMSIVGPRPERPELLENLALAIPYFEERMRGVKPGITGLAQV